MFDEVSIYMGAVAVMMRCFCWIIVNPYAILPRACESMRVDPHQGVGQHHPCIHRHPWYQHHAANAKHAGVAIRRLTSRCILRGWAATHLLVDMLGEPRPRCAASLWVAALVLPASVAIQQCCGDVDVLLGGLSAEQGADGVHFVRSAV